MTEENTTLEQKYKNYMVQHEQFKSLAEQYDRLAQQALGGAQALKILLDEEKATGDANTTNGEDNTGSPLKPPVSPNAPKDEAPKAKH